jgi:hypothetical protein
MMFADLAGLQGVYWTVAVSAIAAAVVRVALDYVFTRSK